MNGFHGARILLFLFMASFKLLMPMCIYYPVNEQLC